MHDNASTTQCRQKKYLLVSMSIPCNLHVNRLLRKVAPAIIANLAGVDKEHRAARHVSQKHIQVLIQHPLRGAKPAVTSMLAST